MADYWKSNPRYFCEICKCWLADNKASINFHESGQRHKANVQKQLKQARFRSAENEKEQAKTDRTLAAIEQAALQAYQKDLAVEFGEASVQEASLKMIALREKYGGEVDFSGSGRPQSTASDEKDTSKIKEEIQANVQKKLEELQRQKEAVAIQQAAAAQCPWQLHYSPEGYPYYCNTTTGASQWEMPPEYQQTYGAVATPAQSSDYSGSSSAAATAQETTRDSTREGDGDCAGNSSYGAGEHTGKRPAEQAEVEASETYQPIKRRRPGGAYGSWSTVAVYDRTEEEKESNTVEGKGGGEGKGDSSEEDDGDRDNKLKFEEKTVSSLGKSEAEPTAKVGGAFKGFGFKKRAGNRPQIRQLKTNDL